MASQDELAEIANNFILNSPPGEFMEVVTDVRALLPNESLINDSAPRTFREYNTEQMLVVDSPGKGHKALISKYGEVSAGEYLDPQGGQVIQFDHIKQGVTGARPISGELDSSLESLRQAYEKATLDYVAEHYGNGAAPSTPEMARSQFVSLLPSSIQITFGTEDGVLYGPAVEENSLATSRFKFITTKMAMSN